MWGQSADPILYFPFSVPRRTYVFLAILTLTVSPFLYMCVVPHSAAVPERRLGRRQSLLGSLSSEGQTALRKYIGPLENSPLNRSFGPWYHCSGWAIFPCNDFCLMLLDFLPEKIPTWRPPHQRFKNLRIQACFSVCPSPGHGHPRSQQQFCSLWWQGGGHCSFHTHDLFRFGVYGPEATLSFPLHDVNHVLFPWEHTSFLFLYSSQPATFLHRRSLGSIWSRKWDFPSNRSQVSHPGLTIWSCRNWFLYK